MDHLAVANWMFATVNRDEDAEPAPYPDPVPRPGDGATVPADTSAVPELGDAQGATTAEIVAFLNSPG